MKRREKESGERPAVKQENLGEKLKRVEFLVGKRGGHNTPVLTPWRLLQLPPAHDSIITLSPPTFPTPSARKLAATLWELHQYNLPFSKMHQGVTAPLPRLRRHHHQHQHLLKDKGDDPPDPSPCAPDLQPESASSLRRHVAASLMQHHRSIQRNNNYALQPVSPASYGSSMEMAPYNPAVTPTSSIDFKGGIGETSSYSLKTSTELLKVLNRIWGLEEQHAANVSLVRALKRELDHARAKIKELVRTQQSDRHEVDELMKQLTEDKLLRKSKEQDRINAVVQSAREELEDERKLRKRSETLHRKLARELYEVKLSFSNAVKEQERERKSRKLLEDLCDEFALEIRDYEQEVHALKKNQAERGDRDRLILHISESWIDERMQMKLEPQREKNPSIVDKLSSEIEAFLQAKRDGNYKNHNDNKLVEKNPNRRSSIESIPLNVVISAPRDEGDDEEEEESLGSDSHCFELDKPSGAVDLNNPQRDEAEESQILKSKKKPVSENRSTSRHPTSLQVKFEEQMAQAISRNETKNQAEDIEQGQNGESDKKYEICEATERTKKDDGIHGSSSNYIESLIRSHYLLSESGNTKPENDYACGNSTWRSHASPIRQWTATLPSSSQDLETSESSKLPRDLNDGTLKSKLLEARTRGQRSRSRLKSSKVSL